MPTIAEVLVKSHDELGKLEADLRAAIVNKHLADIVGAARGRLADAARHPDAAAQVEQLEQKKAELEKRDEPLAAQIAREQPGHEIEWNAPPAPLRDAPPADPFAPRPASDFGGGAP